MNSGKLFFKTVKEDRAWYFVEYSPPQEAARFAMLNLVVPDAGDKDKIVRAMETEARGWLRRYPIPLMVTAFDDTGSVVHLAPAKECDSLMAFLSKGKDAVSSNWRLLKDTELPDDAVNRERLKNVYADIPYRTSEDIGRELKKQALMVKTVKWFFVFWLVVVPLAVLILDKLNVWVGWMVFAYSLWKIVAELLKLTRKWKKSLRQIEKEKEETEMQHHHYHCKLNPQTFLRLKSENFQREQREHTRACT